MPNATQFSAKEFQKLVDRYAEVYAQAEAWKPQVNPHLKPLADLEDQILARYEAAPAADTHIAEGSRFCIPVTARRHVRKIFNMPGLLKRFGQTKFLSACSITLKFIDDQIPDEAQRAKYVSDEQSGPRSLGAPVMKLEKAA